MLKKILSLSMTLVLLVTALSVGIVLNTSAVSFTTMSSTDEATVAAKHEDNLLAELIPVLTGTTHINNADTLSRVADGVAGGGGDVVAEIRPFSGADAHATGNVTFYFDMGEVKEFNQVLLAGNSSLVKKRYLYNGKVYVGNDPETLFSDANLALNHSQPMSSVAPFLLFDLPATYEGQYVGFSFYHPSASECSWTDYWGGYASITEVGVYHVSGAASWGSVDVADVAANHADNLLAGLVPTLAGTTHINNAATLPRITDGVAGGGSDVVAEIRPFSGADAHATGNVTFYFDLGEARDLNQILLAGNSSLVKKRYLYNGKVYVGNDPETLFTDANLALNHSQPMASVAPFLAFNLDDTYTGQYVGFSFYHPSAEQCSWTDYWGGYASITEVGAYYNESLVNDDSTEKTASLLAGLIATPGNGQNVSGELSSLTDGNLNNAISSDTGSDNDGAAQLSFALDSAYAIDKVVLTSSDEGASFYLYAGSIYVSNTEADLWAADNKVETFTYTQGQVDRILTFEFDEPVAGKYIGFMLDVNGDGWWYRARVSELEAYGTEVVQVNNGAQVRNADATDNYALRFSFDVYNAGVAYADEAPVTNNNYARDLTNAYIKLAGQSYKLKDMGAVVSSTADFGETLTKEDAGNGYIADVPAANLYDVAEGVVTYTAVVTGIPAAHVGTPIYAVSYVTYETVDGDVTIYGDLITRSINDVQNS